MAKSYWPTMWLKCKLLKRWESKKNCFTLPFSKREIWVRQGPLWPSSVFSGVLTLFTDYLIHAEHWTWFLGNKILELELTLVILFIFFENEAFEKRNNFALEEVQLLYRYVCLYQYSWVLWYSKWLIFIWTPTNNTFKYRGSVEW